MRRRDLFPYLGALPALAQQSLPETISYRPYTRCLPEYVRELAADAYQKRNAALARLTTPAAIRARQEWVRKTFWELAGGEPSRTPLQLRTTGEKKYSHYRVEMLVYESQPGLLVSANLYIPTNRQGPFPGVLFQAGHSPEGKAADLYQSCCQGLVQLGFVVLAFDPMGQGERINYPGPNGLTRLPSVDDEHTVPGRQMLLAGDTATRMQTWDAVRSLDVLAAHPMVDAKRLASTGQSGGATVTMMLATADDRLHTIAIVSGNTENMACAGFLPPGSTDDAEQNFLNSGPLGFDRWDLLWPFAPKPLLILGSGKDFFGTYSPNYEQNGREEYQRLHNAYTALGAEAKLQRGESPLPHGLSYPLRLATYNWMERWLKDSREQVAKEPEVQPVPANQLWCTPAGNVRALGGATPYSLLRKSAAAIETPATPADLRQLLGIGTAPPQGSLKNLARVPYGNCDVVAGEVASDPQVWAPFWLFEPRQTSRRTILLLDPAGRNVHWREGGLAHRLAADGLTVCAADLRGIGDLTPQFSSGAPSYTRSHQSEENYAWASLIFGHSLLGQRVTDILAIVHALASRPDMRIAIAAKGKLTVPALCAAALDPRIEAIYLTAPLLSWRCLTESEEYNHSFANFVPNVLRHTDLPELAAQLAPRPITLAGTVDATGRAVPLPRVSQIYSSKNISITSDEGWPAGRLKQIL